MKKLAIGMACLLAVVIGYVLIHIAMIEIGQEIVVAARFAFPLDHELRLGREPLDPEGVRVAVYRGIVDPEVHAQVHRLLREKYGAADRLVRSWAGTDVEPGAATGEL